MKTNPKKFNLAVGYSPDGGATRWILCAETLDDLRAAWDSMRGNPLRMDESKIYHVEWKLCAMHPPSGEANAAVSHGDWERQPESSPNDL